MSPAKLLHNIMFQGKIYRRFGSNGLCIGFADTERQDLDTAIDGGILTMAYASEMNVAERRVIARRVLSALNITSTWAIERIEDAYPAPVRDPGFHAQFCGRTYRRLPGSLKLVIGFDGRCPLHGLFGKNGGFAMVTYADEINQVEKDVMARRVTAALNLTRNFSVEELENLDLL